MGQGYLIGCNECIKDIKSLRPEKNKNITGTHFYIMIGGGMLCFCKEQLERYYGIFKNYNRKYPLLVAGDPSDEFYKNSQSPIENKRINNEIFENIKMGYEFTENLGYLPYYCESCMSLETQFYFQMIKNETLYTPQYFCEMCNDNLKPVGQERENDDRTEDLNPINFELYMSIEDDNIVTIRSNTEEKFLSCKYCNNKKMILFSVIMFD